MENEDTRSSRPESYRNESRPESSGPECVHLHLLLKISYIFCNKLILMMYIQCADFDFASNFTVILQSLLALLGYCVNITLNKLLCQMLVYLNLIICQDLF